MHSPPPYIKRSQSISATFIFFVHSLLNFSSVSNLSLLWRAKQMTKRKKKHRILKIQYLLMLYQALLCCLFVLFWFALLLPCKIRVLKKTKFKFCYVLQNDKPTKPHTQKNQTYIKKILQTYIARLIEISKKPCFCNKNTARIWGLILRGMLISIVFEFFDIWLCFSDI